MRVLVKKDLFDIKLNKLSKFSGDVKLVPVYGNFLIKAKENNIMEITCGDGNTFVTDTYNLVQVETPGEITVNAQKLSKLVSGLGSKEEIILSLVDNRLVVKSGKSEFKLETIPASQYPKIPVEFSEPIGDLPIKELQAALRCGKVCVAKDMTNPYLTGYKIDSDLFTSDSLKICIYNENFGGAHLLVSAACVDAILLMNGSEQVKVSKEGHSILFDCEGFRIVSNMIGGIEKFPKSDMFINQELANTVVLNRATLLPILNRASIFTLEDLSHAVLLKFTNGHLQVSSYNTKDGAGSFEELDCEYNGEDISILVDGQDFVDELGGLASDEFDFAFEADSGNAKISQGKVIYILSVLDLNEQAQGENK